MTTDCAFETSTGIMIGRQLLPLFVQGFMRWLIKKAEQNQLRV
jgi:hypothetical protein